MSLQQAQLKWQLTTRTAEVELDRLGDVLRFLSEIDMQQGAQRLVDDVKQQLRVLEREHSKAQAESVRDPRDLLHRPDATVGQADAAEVARMRAEIAEKQAALDADKAELDASMIGRVDLTAQCAAKYENVRAALLAKHGSFIRYIMVRFKFSKAQANALADPRCTMVFIENSATGKKLELLAKKEGDLPVIVSFCNAPCEAERVRTGTAHNFVIQVGPRLVIVPVDPSEAAKSLIRDALRDKEAMPIVVSIEHLAVLTASTTEGTFAKTIFNSSVKRAPICTLSGATLGDDVTIRGGIKVLLPIRMVGPPRKDGLLVVRFSNPLEAASRSNPLVKRGHGTFCLQPLIGAAATERHMKALIAAIAHPKTGENPPILVDGTTQCREHCETVAPTAEALLALLCSQQAADSPLDADAAALLELREAAVAAEVTEAANSKPKPVNDSLESDDAGAADTDDELRALIEGVRKYGLGR